MNLLKETIEKIEKNGKSTQDVIWCGSKAFGYFSWEDFVSISNTEYDDGFGAQEVADDLIVCGKDWWLERHESDGSEWWEFKTTPVRPEEYKQPTCLTIKQANEKGFDVSCGWLELKEINGID